MAQGTKNDGSWTGMDGEETSIVASIGIVALAIVAITVTIAIGTNLKNQRMMENEQISNMNLRDVQLTCIQTGGDWTIIPQENPAATVRMGCLKD